MYPYNESLPLLISQYVLRCSNFFGVRLENPKINKRGALNNSGGGEIFFKKNKRGCPFIPDLRVENFDPNNVKLDEKPYKNILIFYIGYVTIKNSKYVKIYSVNSLYLLFNKANEYFEENNGNKYLKLVPTNESKEKIKNMKNFGVKSEI